MDKPIKAHSRFTGYTLADCACIYCLYYSKKRGCSQEVCCCEAEKQEAMEREAGVYRHGS